jgi:hypothetical protein
MRQMNPAGTNRQAAHRDMVQDAVHQMVAAEGAGGVGDVGRDAGIAHGAHHRADRQGGVIGGRPVGYRQFALHPAAGIVEQPVARAVVEILRDPFHRHHRAPAILAHHHDRLGPHLGDSGTHDIDAGEEAARHHPRHDPGAFDLDSVQGPRHMLGGIDRRMAERFEARHQDRLHCAVVSLKSRVATMNPGSIPRMTQGRRSDV